VAKMHRTRNVRKKQKYTSSEGLYIYFFSLPPPDLPTLQDCHELTSKRRRRELREQQAAALQNLLPKSSAQPLSTVDP